MNKNESKYFNTAVKMDEALIELLEKKDFEFITIKEICQKAGVNRSTFYLHYENTRDLLRETTQYIINNFNSYFPVDRKKIKENYNKRDLTGLVFITPEYLLPYLTYIKENQKVFKTSVKQLGTMNFDDYYNNLFKFIFDPVLECFDFPQKERKYTLKFYLTGITAVVMEWLGNDCKDTMEDISKIIIQCVFGKDTQTEMLKKDRW